MRSIASSTGKHLELVECVRAAETEPVVCGALRDDGGVLRLPAPALHRGPDAMGEPVRACDRARRAP